MARKEWGFSETWGGQYLGILHGEQFSSWMGVVSGGMLCHFGQPWGGWPKLRIQTETGLLTRKCHSFCMGVRSVGAQEASDWLFFKGPSTFT